MEKRRPEYWKAPAVLWFLEQTERVDPEEAIRAKAQALLIDSGSEAPPFDPTRVANLRKVHSIRSASIPSVSQLLPINDGFILTINSVNSNTGQKQGRYRFSIAHEIGHTFFYNIKLSKPVRPQGDRGSEAEERLCDIFAAELLMPTEHFKKDALQIYNQLGSWCEALFELKSLYKVSMRAAVERILELKIIEGALFIKWRWKPKAKTGTDPCLRVDWSLPLKDGHHYFVWPDKPATPDSVFYRASQTKRILKEMAKIKLGSLRGNFIVEAKSYGGSSISNNQQHNSVLSIIWFSGTN